MYAGLALVTTKRLGFLLVRHPAWAASFAVGFAAGVYEELRGDEAPFIGCLTNQEIDERLAGCPATSAPERAAA